MQPIKLFCFLPLLLYFSLPSAGQIHPRTDTLLIPESTQIPIIDGLSSDAAWEITEWILIDQIWMPYGNDPGNLGQESGLELWEGADDFTGKFKVVWSAETNLLYFLAEIIDDEFVDGYVYNENPGSGGGYPNYDILEVFIDDDRSGGLHVFDGTGSVASSWGTNAENAFSYHLAVNAPEEGAVQNEFYALDIAGTNWGYPNQKVADYAGHFPEFAFRKEGNKYVWEFSMKVHNDNYDHSNQEASVVALEPGKVMGLSLAYCDNDDPNESPLRRDHFFGSVDVPLSAYNDHWKQADWFGVAKLVQSPGTFSLFKTKHQLKIEIFAANGSLMVNLNSPKEGKVYIRVLNILGREVFKRTDFKPGGEWRNQLNIQDLQNGIYLVEIIHDNKRNTQKIILQ
ncbi:MAG: T9SS type A sorting domain-containing protein [Mariniphaga sp.]|nr:T9SS type A sorting domain-containing protein [Mariniphaga sp.]